MSSLRGGVTYALEVRARWFMPVRWAGPGPAVVTLERNGAAEVRLVVEANRRTISGRVVDRQGKPVPDMHVIARHEVSTTREWRHLPPAQPARGFSDAGGAFVIEDLPAGTFALSVERGPHDKADLQGVPSGTAGHTIRVDEPGTIEVTASGFSAMPTIRAGRDGRPWPQGAPSEVIASISRFRDVPPGRYLVAAHARGQYASGWVEVRSSLTSSIALVAGPMAKIIGRVLSFPEGKPIPGLLCGPVLRVGNARAHGWVHATSGDDGRFELPDVPAGDVLVQCERYEGRTSSVAGSTAPFPIALGSTRQVDVFVVEGKPKGMIGFRFDAASETTTVAEVLPGLPAARAGLLAGDVMVSVDGFAVEVPGPEVAFGLITQHAPGEIVRLEVRRGATIVKLDVVVAARPPE